MQETIKDELKVMKTHYKRGLRVALAFAFILGMVAGYVVG